MKTVEDLWSSVVDEQFYSWLEERKSMGLLTSVSGITNEKYLKAIEQANNFVECGRNAGF